MSCKTLPPSGEVKKKLQILITVSFFNISSSFVADHCEVYPFAKQHGQNNLITSTPLRAWISSLKVLRCQVFGCLVI